MEGVEKVSLALENCSDYEIDMNAAVAQVYIFDNDEWEWTDYVGTTMGTNDVFQMKGLPGYDDFLEDPAWMASFGSITATNNSVTGDITGKFVDPHLLVEPTSELVSRERHLEFDFDPVTGNISLANNISPSSVASAGALSVALGYQFDVDNSQDHEHTVTVSMKFLVVVDGTISYTTGAGGEIEDDGMKGTFNVEVERVSTIGGQIQGDTTITLKLKNVERPDSP